MCVIGATSNSVSSNSNFGSESCKSDRLGCGSSEFSTTRLIAGPKMIMTMIIQHETHIISSCLMFIKHFKKCILHTNLLESINA